MKVIILINFLVFSSIQLIGQCVSGNCSSGDGVFKFKNGSQYTGDFVDGKFQGQGLMEYNNGNVYVGAWFKHKRNGEGVLKFANGDVYKGFFISNQFNGQGEYRHEDGSVYIGEWKDHQANGKGIFTYADGERYEGQFVDGDFEGKGAFYYEDGSVFFGDWIDNKKDGGGILHMKDGQKVKGTWSKDELIERKLPSKSKLSNDPKNTVPHIKPKKEQAPKLSNKERKQKYWKDCNSIYCHKELGQYLYQDGSRWQGGMISGLPQGLGELSYANGNIYEGMFLEHAPNGEGVMQFNTGVTIGGVWKDGYPIKQTRQSYLKESKSRKKETVYSEEVKIWAVIIGVASYAHMPSLKYTDDDAYQMFAFLKSPEGGALADDQIRILIDEAATRSNILAAMNEVLLKADENDVVLMYYSGHGLPGSFLPIDFDGFNNSLSHQEVLDIFNTSEAKHKVCIADACHSGSLLASKSPFNGSELDNFYHSFEETAGGTALMMSSKSQELSLESRGLRQGIFSHFLIRGLKGEADIDLDKIITISELYAFVDEKVKAYTQGMQSPSISGLYDADMPIGMVREN